MNSFDPDVVLTQYNELRSCRAVASLYGCSDETIRRILKKCGQSRTGWKNTTKQSHAQIQKNAAKAVEERAAAYLEFQGDTKKAAVFCKCSRSSILDACHKKKVPVSRDSNAKKILDSELVSEAKTMTAFEIAHKHGMSLERLYKRASKLGIELDFRGGYWNWQSRASFYGAGEFDDTISLERVYARDNGICQICGKPTDYAARKGKRVSSFYPSVDHIVPLSKGGSHTWENVQLAHIGCNSRKRDRISV